MAARCEEVIGNSSALNLLRCKVSMSSDGRLAISVLISGIWSGPAIAGGELIGVNGSVRNSPTSPSRHFKDNS